MRVAWMLFSLPILALGVLPAAAQSARRPAPARAPAVVGAPANAGAPTPDSAFRAEARACDQSGAASAAEIAAACTLALDSSRLDRAGTARAHGTRGLARFALGQKDLAMADLTDAILLGSRDLSHFMTRGMIYSQMRQFDRALEDFDQAVWISQDFPEALTQRGIALTAVGNYRNAIQDFDNAIAAQPDNPVAYEGRSKAYLGLGLRGQAADDELRANRLRRDAGLARAE